MKFINPYDLAFILNFDDLDGYNLKKFKKKLFAELELFDNEIKIKNKNYSKSECLKIINEIESNKKLLNIYYAVTLNEELNNFLYGIFNKQYLKRIKHDLEVEEKVTREFIIPYIKNTFIKIYKEAFVDNELSILKLSIPVGEDQREDIYAPIYKILKNKEIELTDLKNNFYDIAIIKNIIDIEKINSLPSYFNKIIDDIAYAIRNLSIDSWNDKKDINLALALIDLTLKIDTSIKIKEKFRKDKSDLITVNREHDSHKKILEINAIMENKNTTFNQKLQSILLRINNINNDNLIAKATFNLVMKNLDKNTDELIGSFSSLKQVLNRLLIISSDLEFKNIVNKNLNDLDLVENKIEEANNRNDYSWIWWIVGFFIIANMFGK